MSLDSRIKAFAQLSDCINENNEELQSVVVQACLKNPWFNKENVWKALLAIKQQFLDESLLKAWLSHYDSNQFTGGKNVGLVLAGNIPLVGFHDVLSVLLTGHNALIKYSEKDKVLTSYLIEQLIKKSPEFESRIKSVERLKSFDALIATGNNTTGAHFEKYFSHVPNIIRKNRHAVGVIFKDDSVASLKPIGEDVFAYFGLGCRNISKLYIEDGFKLDTFFEAIYDYNHVINHNKYKNNYDYSNALFLLNQVSFLSNNFLLLKCDEEISSRIATLHYSYFNKASDVEKELMVKKDQIQCVLSNKTLDNQRTFKLGSAQQPGLMDYADNVDTVSFLNKL
ncbi:MAG: acyl-CoA reductase [Saprospiraceae bacterium]|nr:acyl-CoA reductase [Bacteroidia bacterium]NNL92801.1 acyl-CoA reductase [Saprospiraceae bacterium]